MERETLVRLTFKAYQEITFINPYNQWPTECMLVAVDFDKEVFLLRPFPFQETQNGNEIVSDDFWASVSHCKPSVPRLKASKLTINKIDKPKDITHGKD